MSRLTNIWKALAGEPVSKPVEPVTKVVGGGTDDNPFLRMGLYSNDDPLRNIADRMKWVRKWRQIYLINGGPVAECIDAYALFALTNGWQLQSDEQLDPSGKLKDNVQAWLDQLNTDLDSIMWQGIVDACVCGTAFQEIIPTAGGGVWGVVPRDASSFWIDYDQYGRTTGYKQITFLMNQVKTVTQIDKSATDRIMTLTLFPVAGEVYGSSLIGRAYDDIMRDCDIIESITKAIHRHGTPKQQWNVGTPECPATDTDLDDIEQEIKSISAKSDFITANTTITPLDTAGIPGIDTYSNLSLQRMATALGVPEEILGLGRGSTEATANVRYKTFMDKIATIQQIVARTYSRKIFDKITGVPGSVWLEFNDPNPDDEAKKAAWMSMMRTGMDPDAVCPAEWCREQLGIPPEEDPLKQELPPAPTLPDEEAGPE